MSTHTIVMPDGMKLSVTDVGAGRPIIFQHGLGGDRHQITESFPSTLSCRRITVECRGHGESGADSSSQYSIAQFSDDVIEVVNYLKLDTFAVGGISMGAAIALRIACLHPLRVKALALVRPAWVLERAPSNMEPFGVLATHLAGYGTEGANHFAASDIGQTMQAESPDNFKSLIGFFKHPNPQMLAELFSCISIDGPSVTKQDLAKLNMPVMAIGNDSDFVHPLSYASVLANMIPTASFTQITAKAVDKLAYFDELNSVLAAFFSPYLFIEENNIEAPKA